MKATIYIPDDKAELYERAKAKLSDSISQTFLRCLETALEHQRITTERIVLDVVIPNSEHLRKIAFEGAWLIGSATEGETHAFEARSGVSGGGPYSVARTKKGGLLVAEFNEYGDITEWGTFTDYRDFSTAQIDGKYPKFPESLLSAVASVLGEEHVEELDI